MEWLVFSAPVPGVVEADVGVAFVLSLIGFIVGVAPAVLAARYVVSARGLAGLIPRPSFPEGFGRESRRPA